MIATETYPLPVTLKHLPWVEERIGGNVYFLRLNLFFLSAAKSISEPVNKTTNKSLLILKTGEDPQDLDRGYII